MEKEILALKILALTNELRFWTNNIDEIPSSRRQSLYEMAGALTRALQIDRLAKEGLPVLRDEIDARLWQDYCIKSKGILSSVEWIDYRNMTRRGYNVDGCNHISEPNE